MNKTAIDYRGLKVCEYCNLDRSSIHTYKRCDWSIYTASDSGDVRDITGCLIFNTKIAPDIILVMFIANIILYIMGLNGLQKLNPFYRKACKVYIAYLIFMFLSIIAFVVFGFAASEFVVISFRSDSINTGTVSVLIWTFCDNVSCSTGC